MTAARRPSPLWIWSGEEASRALRTRDLAVILRTYRRLNGLSQDRLALALGYDKTYISMIETRRRTINDVGVLRSIAHSLAIPVHVLGVTEADDATYAAMLQFADSILSLAEVARRAGRAVDAINELWPLVARLEARAAEGFLDRESLGLLARSRVALGIALGTVLPEEKLSTAARWTGQALIVAEKLDDSAFLAPLTMHGNELRKAGHVSAAVARLQRAIDLAPNISAKASAGAFLARAAGETGDNTLFDRTMDAYRRQIDQIDAVGMLTNRFTLREIQMQGLIATGRPAAAAQVLAGPREVEHPVAPQWMVIERVTAAHVLLASGQRDGALEAMQAALTGAETYRLPHQAQRLARVAHAGRHDEIANAAHALVTHLGARLVLQQ